MTMPIATQLADAITTIKGRLYAKAGELYWRKPSNGTIYQLTPPGGGGGSNLIPTALIDPFITPTVCQPGFLTMLEGSNSNSTISLANGTATGDRLGISMFCNTGPVAGSIFVNRGTNLPVGSWFPQVARLAYDIGEAKALIFIWSEEFVPGPSWLLESATVYEGELV